MKPYHKITLIYFVFGLFWIFVSDRILDIFAGSPELLSALQTYKGFFFILITSLILFSLIRKSYLDLENREEEKMEIFHATVRAMHHILNNFLHKMTYFKILAEDNHEVKEETLKQYDSVIKETSERILKLSQITEITTDEIEKTVYSGKSGKE